MPKSYFIKHYLKLKNPIIEAKFSDNAILVIDVKNILYTFDSAFSSNGIIKLSKDEVKHHLYDKRYSIANNSIAIPTTKNLLWAEYGKKVKAVHKTDIHSSPVVFTNYSKCSSYLLSSCEKGKTYLHDTASKTVHYVFANKPDYCSYATISQNNRFALVAYYNSTNVILDLKNDTVMDFKTKYPIELAAFFDNEQKLLLADRQGNSIIYDCVKQCIVHQKAIFTQWVSAIVLAPSKKYFIVSTRTKKLYFVDPYSNELIQTLELEDDGVTAMDIKDNTLLLSFTNGTLATIDLSYLKEQFLIHLQLKEYAEAKDILDSNCFLYLDESMESFKARFDEIFAKAKELIAKNMLDKAIEMVNPFMVYEEHKKNLNRLFKHQQHIVSFVEAMENKEIARAYFIAKKYSIVQSLALYNSLEKQWEFHFARARKILEEDYPRGLERAKEILSPYERVVQKSALVGRLLSNVGVFKKLDTALKKQDFALFFKLCDEYSFLKDTVLYKRVENLGLSLRDKALSFYNDGAYEKAEKTYKTLLYFPTYKEIALHEIEKVKQIIEFSNYVKKDMKASAYEMVGRNNFLSFTELFEELNRPFDEAMQRALVFAKSGNVNLVRNELTHFLEIKELHNKIDSCMKIAYLNQIEKCDFSLSERELILKKYNFLFGLDDLLKGLFDKKGYKEEYLEFEKAPQKIESMRYEECLYM